MPLNSNNRWEIEEWDDFIFQDSLLTESAIANARALYSVDENGCLARLREEYLRIAGVHLSLWTSFHSDLDQVRELERSRYRPSSLPDVQLDWSAIAREHSESFLHEASTFSLDNGFEMCAAYVCQRIEEVYEELYFLYEEYNVLHARRGRVLNHV